MKALWNGKIIAQSNETLIVEGNHYFPIESVNNDFLNDSETSSTCPWKGKASYYSLNVDEKINKDAAWYYPSPKPEANKIKGMVAFWKGVEIVKE